MNPVVQYFLLLAVMAGVTYLIRLLPFLFCRKKMTNRYLLSFLYYIPYTVLAAMTVPAAFYSTGSLVTAAAALTVAVLLAFFRRSLVTVAACSSLAALLASLLLRLIG